MNLIPCILYLLLVFLILTEHLTPTHGCTVNYTLPELGPVSRLQHSQAKVEYLASVGRVMYPRVAHMVNRYRVRIPSPTVEPRSVSADVLFPYQVVLNDEGLEQMYRSLRVFYGTLHNMEIIEDELHYALYTSQNYKPRLRILKRMLLTPINILQVALFRRETEEALSTVRVDTVCNYRNVYSFVMKSIRDLETMEIYFQQMAMLQV